MEPTLMTIGQFAEATRLSIKALRLYDRLSLLAPWQVDPQTNYRFYGVHQLDQARLIRQLREIDMPLATIQQVLTAAPEQAEALVQQYIEEQEHRLKLFQRLSSRILATLRGELMSLEVTVREIAEQPILYIRNHILVGELDSAIQNGVKQLLEVVEQHGLTPTETPFGIYHGPINHEENGPLDVCVAVNKLPTTKLPVETRIEPLMRYASVEMPPEKCNFPEILEGYDTTQGWIQHNGYEMAGSPREYWHNCDKLEIAWPFKQRTNA